MSSSRTKASATKERILVKLLSQMAEIQREGVCQRIAAARREAGLTQEEMADILDITTRGYQAYESGRVPWRRLDQIAEITGRTKQWLIHGDPKDEPPALDSASFVEVMRDLTSEIRRLNERIDKLEGGGGGAMADAVE